MALLVRRPPKAEIAVAKFHPDASLVTQPNHFHHKRNTGSVDLLLHLLSNLVQLPVTKSLVISTGMGKSIGQIEKHRICVGTANEAAIIDRIQHVKEAWHASVKQRKNQDLAPPPVNHNIMLPAKRMAENEGTSPSATKKVKMVVVAEETSKKSFSSLLKKVSGSDTASRPSPTVSPPTKASAPAVPKPLKQKKVSMRVKWADHFGSELCSAQTIEGALPSESATTTNDSSVSWSDRKKRDRLREKELLTKVKYVQVLWEGFEVSDPHPSQVSFVI